MSKSALDLQSLLGGERKKLGGEIYESLLGLATPAKEPERAPWQEAIRESISTIADVYGIDNPVAKQEERREKAITKKWKTLTSQVDIYKQIGNILHPSKKERSLDKTWLDMMARQEGYKGWNSAPTETQKILFNKLFARKQDEYASRMVQAALARKHIQEQFGRNLSIEALDKITDKVVILKDMDDLLDAIRVAYPTGEDTATSAARMLIVGARATKYTKFIPFNLTKIQNVKERKVAELYNTLGIRLKSLVTENRLTDQDADRAWDALGRGWQTSPAEAFHQLKGTRNSIRRALAAKLSSYTEGGFKRLPQLKLEKYIKDIGKVKVGVPVDPVNLNNLKLIEK
jgi:hypothetical protein